MPDLDGYSIVVDLDGTSLRYEPCMQVEPALLRLLDTLQQRGARWIMNSDRFIDDMLELCDGIDVDLRPAALLSSQRYVFVRDGNSWYRPHRAWNDRQEAVHSTLWRRIKARFPVWQHEIEQRFTPITSYINDFVFAYMFEPSQASQAHALLSTLVADVADVQVSGNHEWVFLLHRSFSKRRILLETMRLLGLSRERMIAIGDGFNDITMLDGSVTRMVGCPSNASADVKQAVRDAGGYIAAAAEAAGSIEVIRHYLDVSA